MSSLKFGTSGLRGLVGDLVGAPSFAYTLAFLRHLEAVAPASARDRVLLVGQDLRASSPAIARSCLAAAEAAGYTPLDCGALPTPALALAAMAHGAAGVMVTGSHIPDDRNGLKFYRPDGEIDKDDEAGIVSAFAALRTVGTPPEAAVAAPYPALAAYITRYLDFFPRDVLAGLTIGVYEQSSVARDVLSEVLSALGARVEGLARSDRFIPVDTEAHRPEDKALIAGWAADGRFDAIVSTDGDADRPLVADETGSILRGDILGLLTAGHLGIGTIVTPITSTSAIETSGIAARVLRTRVGSPYVIAGMLAAGDGTVLGFEANGGVLLGTPIERAGRRLAALPTRDALLPIIAVLATVAAKGQSLSQVVAGLDAGHTAAYRLQDVPAARSGELLRRLGDDAAYRGDFMGDVGAVVAVDRLDGVHMTLADGSVIHFRASGNAPELRCYIQAADAQRAESLLAWGLARADAAMAALA
ncbi:phosphomannomutase [Aureimonas glaciei]|uniref:Phosphomannomutase n=1 Tax=Aureimonas glaciei TaxID=1776957 RepID=A0A916XVV1_9HYPH|nr:phosphomannomutase [Aureimonas glaciei]GGD14089.1 phosphomannomutase [Aureimonas glaciei]